MAGRPCHCANFFSFLLFFLGSFRINKSFSKIEQMHLVGFVVGERFTLSLPYFRMFERYIGYVYIYIFIYELV